ncbi:MAG: hypothetical protein FWE08_08980 [Oscillospiraceae bacterium]|nr:hypothetical protein [Oscillospiraceae bacterium]
MSIAKRVTYLKGLAEGLNLGHDTKEEKILQVMIEILEDISAELEELADDVTALDDDMSVLIEDLESLEEDLEYMFSEEDDEEDEPGCCPAQSAPLPSAPAASGNGRKNGNGHKQQFYAVKCPTCQSEITIDDDVLKQGVIDCPNCGERLELDTEE